MSLFTPSPEFLKVFLSGMLPLFALILSVIVWTIAYVVCHKRCSNWKRNVIVTNVVTLFLLHPNLTKQFLSVFECIYISENEARVKIDLQMGCFSSQHVLWSLAFAIPMLLIWSIGIPLTAFMILFKNKNNLEETEVKKYYLMIYQGFKTNRYYWEFVNTIRKVGILSVNVFLSTQSIYYPLLSIT